MPALNSGACCKKYGLIMTEKKTLKKIAIVTPYYYPLAGGVQEYVYHLKKEYKKIGYFVKVITADFGGPSFDEQDVIRMGKGFPVLINGSTGRVILFHKKNMIKQVLDKYNFDILHFQEPFVPFLSHEIIKHSHSKNVATFHANFNSNLFYRLSRGYLNPLWKKLHGRIAVSASARRSILKYFSGDVEIIPNGVSINRFNPKNKKLKAFNDGKINILFVGRIEKRKGLIYLLKAYKKLSSRHHNLRLIIVGRGPLLKQYIKFAEKNRLREVYFEGFVPVDDLPRYYSTSSIFCSPAIFGESFGIVLLEAMASGTPVVAFNIPGYNDVVADKSDGLLAKPRDVNDLYEKLDLLVTDKILRKKISANGISKARNFTWEKVSKLNIQYYKKILGIK